MTMKTYIATARCDGTVQIAGRWPQPGNVLELTPEQAEWELARGTIAPAEEPAAEPAPAPPRAATRGRTRGAQAKA